MDHDGNKTFQQLLLLAPPQLYHILVLLTPPVEADPDPESVGYTVGVKHNGRTLLIKFSF